MPMSSIRNVSVTGLEVKVIMESIAKATETHEDEPLVLGCLAMAISVCKPTITKDQLQSGVKLMSEALALWISTLGQEMVVN